MFGWWGQVPKELFESSDQLDFIRLRAQNITLNQQYIIDGIGFSSEWLESGMLTDTQRYAAFDIPAGYYMALDFRQLNPSGEAFYYRVFPSGTYTLGTEKTDDATNYAKTRNMRQDAALAFDSLKRFNVTVAPNNIDALPGTVISWGEPGSGSGNRASGNLAPDNSFLLLSPDQQFLLQLDNQGAGTANAQVSLLYAFIPESAVIASKF